MTKCNNQYDTSHELQICRYGNGIKLKVPGKENNRKNCFSGIDRQPTVFDILQLPCNVYFMDRDSYYKHANELAAETIFSTSVKFSIGKSVRDVGSKESIEKTLKNDVEVMSTDRMLIIEEALQKKTILDLHGLSIKFPWYDNENKTIGIIGFSILLSQQPIAESLANIAQLGLLSSILPNKIITDRVEIDHVQLSKRETDIARLIIHRKTAKEIAKILGLSYRTVEYYLENIKTKTNSYSKPELIDKIMMCINH